MKKTLAIALLAVAAGSAHADTIDVNLAGYSAVGGYLAPGNTNTTISLPAGSTIDSIEYIGVTFEAFGESWIRELAISVNEVGGVEAFWDFNPGVGITNPGVFGPASGNFLIPGLFGSGPFTTVSGGLYIETYDTFNDAGTDATISAGILRITYTPIPTPGAAALLGLGGLAAMRRRR